MNKVEQHKVAGFLHPLHIPNSEWEIISMDFIVCLSRTQRGHNSTWVVVDQLPKLATFIPMKTTITTHELV